MATTPPELTVIMWLYATWWGKSFRVLHGDARQGYIAVVGERPTMELI